MENIESISKIKYWVPIILFFTYSFISLYFFYGGVFTYPIKYHFILPIYLTILFLAIYWGYKRGISTKIRIPKKNININKLMNFILPFVLMYILIQKGGLNFSVSKSIEFLAESRQYYLDVYLGSWESHATLILTIFIFPYIILGIVYWEKQKKIHHLFTIYSIILFGIISPVIEGNRANMYIVLICIIICFYMRRRRRIKTVTKKRFIQNLLLSIFVISFLIYSNEVTNKRMPTNNIDYTQYLESVSEFKIKENNILLTYAPIGIQHLLSTMEFYFGHCYYGLYLSIIDKKYIPGIVLSHSSFVNLNLAKILDSQEILKLNYFNKLTMENTLSKSYWVTGYAFVASDVGFLGTIFIFYYLAYLMGQAWKSALLSEMNPYPVILSVVLFMTFLSIHSGFFPSNYGYFILFYGSIYLYFKTTKALN